MHPYVDSGAVYNAQVLETAWVPIRRWVDTKAVVHLHNGILHSLDETGHYGSKWNKPVNERKIPYDLTYNWNLMNKINEWAK